MTLSSIERHCHLSVLLVIFFDRRKIQSTLYTLHMLVHVHVHVCMYKLVSNVKCTFTTQLHNNTFCTSNSVQVFCMYECKMLSSV